MGGEDTPLTVRAELQRRGVAAAGVTISLQDVRCYVIQASLRLRFVLPLTVGTCHPRLA
jgi:hypothetical protein